MRQAYADAFTSTNSPEVRSAAVEDSDQLAALAKQAGLNALAMAGGPTAEQLDGMTVETADLAFTDETHAVVLFTLHMPGRSGVGQRVGYAVLRDGRWKVARQTQCENFAMVDVQCP